MISSTSLITVNISIIRFSPVQGMQPFSPALPFPRSRTCAMSKRAYRIPRPGFDDTTRFNGKKSASRQGNAESVRNDGRYINEGIHRGHAKLARFCNFGDNLPCQSVRIAMQ